MPLGAPNNDRVGIDRPGNGLFGSSVVAVNADTGKYLWHFQMVHHDAWDYDAPEAPLLVNIRHGGKTIPAVMAMDKASLLFTLDRVTGKPIFPVEERPVPASDVPGEKMSPTQPFPTKPAADRPAHRLRATISTRAIRRFSPIASIWWTTTI